MPKHKIPQSLRGADYVKTFDDNMERSDIEITVRLASAADLYVFLDDRVRAYVPTWIKERFQPTGWKIVLDEGFPDQPNYPYPGKSFSVWRMSVPGPQDVKLRGNGRYTAKEVETMNPLDADLAMYGIAAVARPEATGKRRD